QSQVGYFNEVRRVSEQIRETVPKDFERAQAVADLLWCESFMYEADMQTHNLPEKPASLTPEQRALYEQALREFAGFEERHPNRPREISMANHMQGFLAAELGRWEEAVSHFERNMKLDTSDPREGFYW